METIYIDIKEADYRKLNLRRHQANYWGHLGSSSGDYVPAKITHNNKTVKARVRLKGDLADHWNVPVGWSMRIKIRGDETILGMKTFSIQNPKTRSGIWEWLAFEFSRRAGAIAGRYEFIRGIVNGRDTGIYAIEESFEKRLIEFNRRREGVILKFSEADYWFERYTRDPPPGFSYLAREIDSFQSNKTSKDPNLRLQYITAHQLLDGFRCGEYRARDVFDMKRVAQYLVVTDIFGSWHAKLLNQLRFYYNPVLSKFELIAYDFSQPGELKYPASSFWNEKEEGLFYLRLFDDPQMMGAYIEVLEKVCSSRYLDDLFEDLRVPMEHRLALLRTFSKKFGVMGREVLYANRSKLRNHLVRIRSGSRWLGLTAQPGTCDQGGCTVVVKNLGSRRLEVLNVSRGKEIIANFDPLELAPFEEGKTVEKPIWFKSNGAKKRMSKTDFLDLSVTYREVDTRKTYSRNVRPRPRTIKGFSDEDLPRFPANIDAFSFLKVGPDGKSLLILPGDWVLDQSLIIPRGYTVTAGPGTVLRLRNRANIISYSPLDWSGTKESPILIVSEKAGQGLAVLQAEGLSQLNYVEFRGLSNPARKYWLLTGAVTFYESNVKMRDCKFLDSRCEDGLNIIRSEINLVRIIFRGSQSDALDCDFVQGTISDSKFLTSGNDALDFSGSEIRLARVNIEGAGDKGLSAGEASRIDVDGLTVRKVKVGVASKDLSEVSLSRLLVADSQVGLAVYKKKSEFGPGSIRATRPKFEQLESDYLVEEKSKLVLNGRLVVGKRKSIKDDLE